MRTTAIIVAAGAGVRMGASRPKAFLELDGRPLVAHSLELFQRHPAVDAIVLMVPGGLTHEAAAIASSFGKVAAVSEGGGRRQDTVRLALERARSLGGGAGHHVLVHDAARPFVTAEVVDAVLEAARRTGAAVPGLPPADTVRETRTSGPSGPILAGGTLDRQRLVLVQTPQAFRLEVLERAHAEAGTAEVTDDAALLERLGVPVEVVQGSAMNVKITTADDLARAAAWIRGR